MSERRYQTGKHLEAFLLLMLREEPGHGADLLGRLEAFLPSDWTIDHGRLYRLLREMEGEGLVRSEWVTPGEGAPVRVYRLEARGLARLRLWREEIEVRRRSLCLFLDRYRELEAGSGGESVEV